MPSAWPIIEGVNNDILNGNLYKALKEVKKLIAYEKTLIDSTVANVDDVTAKERRSA
jgi:flagellar protein FlbT